MSSEEPPLDIQLATDVVARFRQEALVMQQRIPYTPPRHLVAVSAPFRNPLAPIPPARVRTLLPVIARHSDLTPALERLLRPVALRARDGDWAARDALYAAFEPKLYRIARKIWIPAQSDSTVGTWDFEDVWQEAWIVFATLLETWPIHIDLGRYILAQFPWRLRDAVRKTLRRTVVPPRLHDWNATTEEIADLRPHDQDENSTLLRLLADDLAPVHAEIFRRHLLDRESLIAIAQDLGMGERTIRRHWQTIRMALRQSLQSA